MTTVTLEEKRLKALKQQLFGKTDSAIYKETPGRLKETVSSTTVVSAGSFDSINLKSDLLKIAILSLAAMAIQFSLFLANQNGLIKLFR